MGPYFMIQTKQSIQHLIFIYVVGKVGSSNVELTSDERIKTEIESVPDQLALNQVRALDCKYYHYKDPETRKSQKTIGFIAQDVDKIIPNAISKITRIVPDILETPSNITWVKDSDNKHIVTLTLSKQITVGTKVELRFNKKGNNYTDTVKEVISSTGKNCSFELDNKYDDIFVYGTLVDDFHYLDKNQIFALHHSAIQEIDKKIDSLDTTFTTHSDINDTRLISNINEYDTKNSLDVINNIPLKLYDNKEGDSKLGFISNDVQQVIPESVEKTNQYKPDIMEIINEPEYTEINPDQFEVKFSYQAGLNKDTNILVKAGLFQFDKPNRNKNTWFR